MTGIVDQEALGRSMLDVTERKFSVAPWKGAQAETLDHAWRRLFGEAMTPPLLFHYVRAGGRELVVRCHAKGRVSVLDTIGGRHEIRTLKKNWERVVNASEERRGVRGEERMAAAAVRFVQQRSAM